MRDRIDHPNKRFILVIFAIHSTYPLAGQAGADRLGEAGGLQTPAHGDKMRHEGQAQTALDRMPSIASGGLQLLCDLGQMSMAAQVVGADIFVRFAEERAQLEAASGPTNASKCGHDDIRSDKACRQSWQKG